MNKGQFLLALIVAGCATMATTRLASAYEINGNYAQLLSCDYGYSAVRGESGYTGTYKVMSEIWTVYFGSDYCQF